MALVVADRVQETTTTTGTGTITLAGASAGYQSFAVIGNGNTTYYTLTSGNNWEVGVGTYATSGPTLARTTVLASSAGGITPITLSGTSSVFVTYPAEIATMLTNPVPTNGGVVYGTGTAINVSAAGTVNGYQFLQSAGAASPTWVQINSFKDVAVAPTSPTPIEGDRFFDNTTGIDYTYITDVDGSQWVETAPGNLASVAGGSSTQVQYNNAGILGGITGATTNGTVLTLTTPVLGAATGTSLALGGATLGSNALAVTGTTALSGLLTAAGGVSSTLTTDATSSTTGSIISAGGISCQKALFVGTTATLGIGTTPASITLNGQSGTGAAKGWAILPQVAGVAAGIIGSESYVFGSSDTNLVIQAATSKSIKLFGGAGGSGLTISSTGTATFDGLIDISGASAGQIKFPATQNASANANTLDDYEEGTFTPVFSFAGGTTGMATNCSGTYVKIGKVVTASIFLILTTKGSSTGQARFASLPFTTVANQYGAGCVVNNFYNMTLTGQIAVNAWNTAGTSVLDCWALNDGTMSALTDTAFSASSQFYPLFTYITSA